MRPRCSRCRKEVEPGQKSVECGPYLYHLECFGQGGDVINHPVHYANADPTYETIRVIEAWDLGFHLGNTIKYISRAGRKGDEVEDLKKARWYLERRISQLEGS